MERHMGNDNKIKKNLEKVSSEFLPEEIRDVDTPKIEYSIEEEFARTGTNKNIGMLLFLAGFIAGAILLTIIGSTFMQSQNKSIEVAVSDFQDLRLKDLLDKAKHDENSLERLRRELSDLEMERDNKVLAIQDAYRIKRQKIIESGLSDAQKQKKIAALARAEKRQVAATRSEYNGKIADKKKEIAELENKIDKEVYEKGSATSNVDKLYKMKMDRLKSMHKSEVSSLKRNHQRQIDLLTLKYNPKYRSYQLKKIIAGKTEETSNPTLHPYRYILQRELSYGPSRFSELRKKIEDRGKLIKRMNQVPYKNSIAPSLEKIDALTDSILADYETLWYGLGQRLDSYTYALDTMLQTRPESGYVMDPRNTDRISVYLNRIVNVPSGTPAYVFRSDDEYIGTIELVRGSGGYTARLVKLNSGKGLKAFDKILLKIKRK